MILWADSFDGYGGAGNEALMTNGLWLQQSECDLSTTQARTGDNSLRFNMTGVPGFVRRGLGAAKTVAKLGAAYWFDDLPSANDAIYCHRFNDGGNVPQVTIYIQSTGALAVYRGDLSGTLLATSDALLTARGWNHIETKVKIDDADGFVEVRLNGVTVVNVTGEDTKATTNAETSQVLIGSGQNLSQETFWYVEDVIASDDHGAENTDFIGDKKVYTDFCDADTAEVDWTPSSGANRFSRLNEDPPDGDTTFVSTAIVGHRFGVTFPALPDEVVSVSAVIFVHESKKTDAGDCNITVHLDSGGDEADGTDRPVTTAYTDYLDVFETDPHTSSLFTPLAAGAASMVSERTA